MAAKLCVVEKLSEGVTLLANTALVVMVWGSAVSEHVVCLLKLS